ncbi:dienelactone hydrolase family protein [Aerosakkonemataceae cyanobacterium BLCC-F154]|uniref:Dienelactone hydrolase family protein n=1 Tax=Floridaenema fluviatile BLCC-F154 TaxID=3153640 RepID=A0ABV4Y7Q6_9CYAN
MMNVPPNGKQAKRQKLFLQGFNFLPQISTDKHRWTQMDMNKTLEYNNQEVWISSGIVNLEGSLAQPENARGIILFAHGSGSSRNSPRNQYVAQELNKAEFSTLLFDLLTPDEESTDQESEDLRFNITFLAERLVDATQWVAQNLDIQNIQIGYFGASTGAAAALVAAAQFPDAVGAVVSRGGRPDLAGSSLSNVQAPTLLIVGEKDSPVIGMNQEALAQLSGEKKLEIVPGASHLFEEPGALEEIAKMARQWFEQYLVKS